MSAQIQVKKKKEKNSPGEASHHCLLCQGLLWVRSSLLCEYRWGTFSTNSSHRLIFKSESATLQYFETQSFVLPGCTKVVLIVSFDCDRNRLLVSRWAIEDVIGFIHKAQIIEFKVV